MSDPLYPAHQRIEPERRHLARVDLVPLPALPLPSPERVDSSITPAPLFARRPRRMPAHAIMLLSALCGAGT